MFSFFTRSGGVQLVMTGMCSVVRIIFTQNIICAVSVIVGLEIEYGGQDTWPGVCTTGRRQSPIDIEVSSEHTGYYIHRVPLHQASAFTVRCARTPLKFTGYNQPLSSFTIANNG